MRKIGILCIALVLALALVIPSAAYARNGPPFVPEAPPGVGPVVFVHGGAGSAQQFESQAMRFASNGWPMDLLFAFEYDSTFGTQSLPAVIARLNVFIDSVLGQTGADKVYLMGHSLGTAVSQTYLSVPPYAAKVAKYVNIDGGTASALPGGVPTLALWAGAGWSYNPLNEIVGATNIHLTDQTHVQTATSPEAFAAMYEFFTGQAPATTDVLPVPPGEVEIAGRAVFFPQNMGVGDATVEIWEVNGATGYRIYDEPVASCTVSGTGYYDGAWGPVAVNGLKHYEIVLLREGARDHHFYFEPFMRNDYFVRLQTSAAGGIGDQMERDLNSSALVITRQKEFWGDQSSGNDTLTINGVNIINAATCPVIKIPGFTGVVGIFAYDRFLNGVTDLSAPIPYFFGVAFMTGVDIYIPAADPPDGTTSLVLTPRGGGGLTQVINTPNWASLYNSVSVVFNDYVQQIDSFPEYMLALHP
jgi:pimeloyl-ACP methyl ester carboxylesterase